MATTYYTLNVNYPVGIRMHSRDRIGKMLLEGDDWVAVQEDELRDFKLANKYAILNGLIVEGEEPRTDWVTPNSITDEEIVTLVTGPFTTLKNKLDEVSSIPIVVKILDIAKQQDRPQKTLTLIQNRLNELNGEDEDFTNAREVLNK